MISYNQFFQKFTGVVGRMEDAARRAGRDPSGISLLPVTKTHPKEAVEFSGRAGLGRIGENRVQEAAAKRSEVRGVPDLRWDLIGHLQSNKAALALEVFDRIQSVDSWKLARRLDRLAGERNRRLPCLIQVNTAGDPRKYGFDSGQLLEDCEQLVHFEHLEMEGLMTIGPLEGGRDAARRAFAGLRELVERLRQRTGLALPELSMGMSGDLEEAVAEGSTLIRVGSALFGERDP